MIRPAIGASWLFSARLGESGFPDKKNTDAGMRLLIIQIPCLNEEHQLPALLRELPRKLDGFDQVKWLVVDDGSTDRTVEVAREHGVDYILSFAKHEGLARAFSAGLECALRAGADVIVNTDADNQYSSRSIPDLVRPILAGEAKIVIGERPISDIESFSNSTKILQRVGSWAVRLFSETTVPDVTSGFRAFHRDAAIQLNVFGPYTYTLETIIQAGLRSLPITSVRIGVNPVTRPSRLISSVPSYVLHSIVTILRVWFIYAPARLFGILVVMCMAPTIFIWVLFLVRYWLGTGQGHIQSLILSIALAGMGGVFALAGLVSHLMATNRILLEDIRSRLIRQGLDQNSVNGAHDAPEPRELRR